MKIGILIITYENEKTILQNLFNSLKDLRPDEICIVDTSEKHSRDFEEWLYNQIELTGSPIGKVRSMPDWKNNQTEIRNYLIEISESDWLVFLDSDEMLTIEAATHLREELESLPPHVFALRIKKLNLIDDEHCLENDLWDGRPPKGHHPLIFQKGAKFIEHPKHMKRHPILWYPGRDSVPYDSDIHPCKDWDGYYMIHLWLYKNMAENWTEEKWQRKEKDDKVIRGNSADYLRQRGWKMRELPKIVTWRKIII